MAASPYTGLAPKDWAAKTKEVIALHPLKPDEIVTVVLRAWEAIFESKIGSFIIGWDIFPKPQTLGFLLHELIALELQSRYPQAWRVEAVGSDKDVNHVTQPQFSFEIKTSSSAGRIFGNRSYAQEGDSSKKDKSGYYLAINFEKCEKGKPRAQIAVIRFGWLDHADWKGQAASTGQQSSLSSDVESGKLLRLHVKK